MKLGACLLMSASALALAPGASAVLIDDFDTGSGALVATGSVVQTNDDDGGDRTLEFDVVTASPASSMFGVDADLVGVTGVDPGALLFGTHTGGAATATLTYNNALNLSSDSMLRFDFLRTDLDFDLEVEVTSGADADTLSATVTGDGLLDMDLSGVGGGVDLGNVTALAITFNTGAVEDVDFTLSSIVAVPEPASLAMAGAGLGLVLMRRRK